MKRLVIALFLVSSCQRHESVVSLVNGSQATVARGVVAICDVVHEVHALPAGDSLIIPFRSCGDTEYRVELALEGGSRVTSQVGYITTGFSFRDRLVIEADSVRLETLSIE
jgi:hypothetical protein